MSYIAIAKKEAKVMTRKYRKLAEWEAIADKLAADIEAGVSLTTLAFYHDVSARRMAEIIDALGLDQPEHYSPTTASSGRATFDSDYHLADVRDIEVACTVSTSTDLDADGNGRKFNPGDL